MASVIASILVSVISSQCFYLYFPCILIKALHKVSHYQMKLINDRFNRKFEIGFSMKIQWEVIISCGFFIFNVIDIFDKVNQIFGIHVKLREKYDFMTL